MATLKQAAKNFAAEYWRNNPPNEDDLIEPATEFIRQIVESGKDTEEWNEKQWLDAAYEFGLDDADVNDFIECLCQWLDV
jgi:hypothetical protein